MAWPGHGVVRPWRGPADLDAVAGREPVEVGEEAVEQAGGPRRAQGVAQAREARHLAAEAGDSDDSDSDDSDDSDEW